MGIRVTWGRKVLKIDGSGVALGTRRRPGPGIFDGWIEAAAAAALPIALGLVALVCFALAATTSLPASVRVWLPLALRDLPPGGVLGLGVSLALGAILIEPLALDWRFFRTERHGVRRRVHAFGRAPLQLLGLALLMQAVVNLWSGHFDWTVAVPTAFGGALLLTYSRLLVFDLDAGKLRYDRGCLGVLRTVSVYDLEEDLLEVEVCDEPYRDEARDREIRPWPHVVLVLLWVSYHLVRSSAHRAGRELAAFLGCELDDWVDPF